MFKWFRQLLSGISFSKASRQHLIKPLTKKEVSEMLKAYERRESEDVYIMAGITSDYPNELMLEEIWEKMSGLHGKKHLKIFNMGVGGISADAADNVVYLWSFFRGKEIVADIHNYEGRRHNIIGLIERLNKLFKNQIPKTLNHFHETDMFIERLEPEADLTVGLRIIPTSPTWGTETPLVHALFDNLVRGTKEGGYIVIDEVPKESLPEADYYKVIRYSDLRKFPDAIKDIDLEAYGLRLVSLETTKNDRRAIAILQRVKMRPILEF